MREFKEEEEGGGGKKEEGRKKEKGRKKEGDSPSKFHKGGGNRGVKGVMKDP